MKTASTLYSWLFSFIITSYIFFWSVELSNYNFRYNILILLVPIFFNFYKKIKNNNDKQYIYKIFSKNKNLIYFLFFIFAHLVIVSIFYDIPFRFYNLKSLIFFNLVAIIYVYYRKEIIVNLDKIISIFVYIFITTLAISFFIENNELIGFCTQKWVILLSNKYFNFYPINNLLFQENSHIGMVLTGVLFYLLFLGINKFYYLLLFFATAFASIFYFSTTYLAGLVFCGLSLSVYYFKKDLNYKKLISINVIIILIATSIIFSDKNCSKKILDIRIKDIYKNNFFSKENKYIFKNTTSAIYERSIKSNINTFKNNILGWGFANNDIATYGFIKNDSHLYLKELHQSNVKAYIHKDGHFYNLENVPWVIHVMNLHDALGNLFKLFNEFGIFTILIFYYFLIYLFREKKIEHYKIFFICIFLVQLFRGAGYLNGGFCFVIVEILLCQKLPKNYLSLRLK
jgi:hypothetical protein